MDLSDLKELDKYNIYRSFIKDFFINCEELFKLVYSPYSSPLDSEIPDNPYSIFVEEQNNNNAHGVVLFKQKNDEVLSYETPVVLINFTSTTQDNNYINIVNIEYKIILKGVNIQELLDESNRAYKIAELIDEQFNHKIIENTGKIKRVSFEKLSINEQNCGYTINYKSVSTLYDSEIEIYKNEQKEDSWGITRESHSLLVTDNPILVGIQEPTIDTKKIQPFGYSIEVIKIMYCDINLNISESSLIKHENKFYRIKEILEYQDYWKCTLEVTYNAIIN